MSATMNCTSQKTANPIEQFIGCFDSVEAAAKGAGISYEMLRRMRHRGYATTRERAIVMATACGDRIAPAELLGLKKKGRAA